MEEGISGVPAASPAAPASGVPAASPAVTPAAPAASPAAAPADGGPAQLRTAYETLKTKHEPWSSKFSDADPNQVHEVWQQHQTARTQGLEIAKTAGYSEAQFNAAVKELGIHAVVSWLQSQVRKNETADPLKALETKLTKQLEPILQEREQAHLQQVFQKFETNAMGLVWEKFGGKEAAKDYGDLATDVYEYASAMMAQDRAAVEAVKKGDLTATQKFVDLAFTRLTGSYKKFGEFMQKRGADSGKGKGNAAATPEKGRKGPSLLDIINGTPEAIAAIPSMRQ